MIKLILELIGLALFVLGLALMVAPTPFGFVLVGVGAVMMITNNKKIAGFVRNLRMRSRSIDKFFRSIELVIPNNWRDGIHQTDPDDFANKHDRRDD